MNEIPSSLTGTHAEVELARERTKQASIVGWTAGMSVFFAVGALITNATWPVAVGVSALAAMVALICRGILKR
jgi:hypothetical protein